MTTCETSSSELIKKITSSDHSNLSSVGLLILRVGVAFSMLYLHGFQKLANFSEFADKFPDPIGIGSTLSLGLVVFAEFFCSILIAIGLFTRLSVFPLLFTMLVAVLIAHSGDIFLIREKAFLYLIAYANLFFSGAGKYSLDYYLSNK